MKRLGAGPAQRADRYATELLHDDPNARIVGFHLASGQMVPDHRSDSTVLLYVTEGEGVFTGEGSRERLSVGQSVVYARRETHSIEAVDGALRFVAVIAPRPD